MWKPWGLKLRRYSARLVDIYQCLAVLPGAKANDKIGDTELNVFKNSIPNIWRRQTYVQSFDCESITLKKAVNMFEWTEIAESIYEGVVEPSHEKSTREDANRDGLSRQKRGGSA